MHWLCIQQLPVKRLSRLLAGHADIKVDLDAAAVSIDDRWCLAACLIESHLCKVDSASRCCSQGPPLNSRNVRRNRVVVRGPEWPGRAEDGGHGGVGTVVAVDEGAGTVAVLWLDTNHCGHGYRYSVNARELCLAIETSESSRRFQLSPIVAPIVMRPAKPAVRNSQAAFAARQQTVIIVDWDDTLFPSTFVRNTLSLSLRHHLDEQDLPERLKLQVRFHLAKCAAAAERLLRIAATKGHVVIVTLARSPWVSSACDLFFPGFAALLEEMDIQVIYAQDGEEDVNDFDNDEEALTFWSELKGRAIASALKEFYSQYQGQSWKNIISLGDSDFERLGTQKATFAYMKERGGVLEPEEPSPATLSRWPGADSPGCGDSTPEAELGGQLYRVRTKTLKTLERPSIDELIVQLGLLRRWLPGMISLDGSFDADLNCLDSADALGIVEERLRGARADTPTGTR